MSGSEKKYHQYFSSRPTLNVTMPLGRRISFRAGVYITDVQDEIEFLDKEVRAGHPMIFTKSGQEVIGEEALDPIAAIKKKAIEDYKRQQEAQANPDRDMGNTAIEKGAGMTTSGGIRNIAVGSRSGAASVVAPQSK